MIGGAWLPLGAVGEVNVDPVSNLSSYGFTGTILAVFAVAGAFMARALLKSQEQQRADLIGRHEQQRIDLLDRIDQANKRTDEANARADRAEEKRDEAIKAVQRAIEEMRALADSTSGKGMEVLQRALTVVAEYEAREKAAQGEIERLRREVERLSRALDRGEG